MICKRQSGLRCAEKIPAPVLSHVGKLRHSTLMAFFPCSFSEPIVSLLSLVLWELFPHFLSKMKRCVRDFVFPGPLLQIPSLLPTTATRFPSLGLMG